MKGSGKILYFPSISIPKSQWLMGALFYWDKVGSIVPLEFLDEPNLLGEHMRKLVEAELIEQVVPEAHLWNVPNFEEAFINFIDNSPVFLPISNLGKLGLIGQNGVIKTTTEIHMGKLRSLGQKLEQRGLCLRVSIKRGMNILCRFFGIIIMMIIRRGKTWEKVTF